MMYAPSCCLLYLMVHAMLIKYHPDPVQPSTWAKFTNFMSPATPSAIRFIGRNAIQPQNIAFSCGGAPKNIQKCQTQRRVHGNFILAGRLEREYNDAHEFCICVVLLRQVKHLDTLWGGIGTLAAVPEWNVDGKARRNISKSNGSAEFTADIQLKQVGRQVYTHIHRYSYVDLYTFSASECAA